jgi:hypothetical protein
MAYRLSYDGPLLLIHLSGTLTRSDLEAIGDDVLALEQGGTNAPPRLTDLREITDAAIGYAEMSQLADRSRTRPLATRVRSALLVAQPLQLGFARMFQILNEHPNVTMQIFEDERAARAWVSGSSPDDPSYRAIAGDLL